MQRFGGGAGATALFTTLGVGWIVLAGLLHGTLLGEIAQAPSPDRKGRTPGWQEAVHLLGGFRPLAIDLMWVRADRLFRQGRYWELAALFRGITSLDPGNARVREFAAWHFAYNVSLAEADGAKRFAWFEKAIELLGGGSDRPVDKARQGTLAGIMMIERKDSGVFPGFADKVARRWGAPPLEIAERWFSEAAETGQATPRTYAAWMASLERLTLEAQEKSEEKKALAYARKHRQVLATARQRYPEEDWDFTDADGER